MVKTYRINKPCGQDHISHICNCGRPATYWSQNENGWKPLGPCVYHCQNCREQARKLAGELKR
jgi:hypothetical protein